jgi:hypothetical protein
MVESKLVPFREIKRWPWSNVFMLRIFCVAIFKIRKLRCIRGSVLSPKCSSYTFFDCSKVSSFKGNYIVFSYFSKAICNGEIV